MLNVQPKKRTRTASDGEKGNGKRVKATTKTTTTTTTTPTMPTMVVTTSVDPIQFRSMNGDERSRLCRAILSGTFASGTDLFEVNLPWSPETGRGNPEDRLIVAINRGTWESKKGEYKFGHSEFEKSFENARVHLESEYEELKRKHESIPKKGGSETSSQRKTLRSMATNVKVTLSSLKHQFLLLEFLDTLGRCPKGECPACNSPLPCPKGGCKYHVSTLGAKNSLFPAWMTSHEEYRQRRSSKPSSGSYSSMIKGNSRSPSTIVVNLKDDDDDEEGDGTDDDDNDDDDGASDLDSSEERAESNDAYSSYDEFLGGLSQEDTDNGAQSDYEPSNDDDGEREYGDFGSWEKDRSEGDKTRSKGRKVYVKLRSSKNDLDDDEEGEEDLEPSTGY